MGSSSNNKVIYKDKIWTRDFILICCANFFIFLGFQMTLPTLPLFVKELGGSDQLIGIVVGIFTFSALIFRPYAGQTLETKGRQFVYMIGLSIFVIRSEEHTSELQSRGHLVCRLLLEKKKNEIRTNTSITGM